jgi:hypothetical protein
MSEKSVKSIENVYQIKITLRDSKPPIWRRLLVPDSISLYKLNQIIQIAMGWTDSHLHQFIIHGEYYSIPSPEDWGPIIDERRSRLDQIAASESDKFIYEYDFGDSWDHEVLVEKILPPEPGVKYPVCIKGKRACPPEDVGGIWGYEEFLEAMSDPNHDEHDRFIAWWGGEFDPEEFDIEEINQVLGKVI